MSRRYPADAYIHVVEALIAYGLEVWVHHETYYGEATGWVIVTAPHANVHTWMLAEQQHMSAVA